jgi:hypothetical protein
MEMTAVVGWMFAATWLNAGRTAQDGMHMKM